MISPQCPKCQSKSYMREKRPDGDTTCEDCGHKDKSVEWDKEAKAWVALRAMIETASNKAFQSTIDQQRGHLDKSFVEMLESSAFFKSFFNEAFVAGMGFSKKMDKENVVFLATDPEGESEPASS